MNRKISTYLKQSRPEFFKGVALYKEFDFDAKLHSQLITKKDTDLNKRLLKTELERLEKIDPKIIADKRKQIKDAAAAALEQEKNEATALAEKEAEDAEALKQKQDKEAIALAAKSFSVEEIASVKELTKSFPELSTKVDRAITAFDEMSTAFDNLKELPKKVEALEKLIGESKKKK